MACCSICQTRSQELLRCGDCKQRLYCTRICQFIDWNARSHCDQCAQAAFIGNGGVALNDVVTLPRDMRLEILSKMETDEVFGMYVQDVAAKRQSWLSPKDLIDIERLRQQSSRQGAVNDGWVFFPNRTVLNYLSSTIKLPEVGAALAAAFPFIDQQRNAPIWEQFSHIMNAAYVGRVNSVEPFFDYPRFRRTLMQLRQDQVRRILSNFSTKAAVDFLIAVWKTDDLIDYESFENHVFWIVRETLNKSPFNREAFLRRELAFFTSYEPLTLVIGNMDEKIAARKLLIVPYSLGTKWYNFNDSVLLATLLDEFGLVKAAAKLRQNIDEIKEEIRQRQ